MGAVTTARSRARVRREARPRIRIGRPAITPEIAQAICERIAGGRVLLDVSGDKDLPGARTIYDEMSRNPAFAAAIAAARRESAHSLAESAVVIADDARLADKPQWVRNRCDQRRWLAGKFHPMYADKTAITDADGGSLVERFRRMNAEQREEALMALAVKAGLVIEHRPAEPKEAKIEDA
ncbi:MAG: hypothetical protein WA459_04690 [Stellaceae bacterium]